MKKVGSIKEETVSKFIGQLLKGYKVFIDNGISHSNINPKNLIVENKTLKINIIGKLGEFDSNSFSIDSRFLAPELFGYRRRYEAKNAIWSIGVITYYMLHGTKDFKKHQDPFETGVYNVSKEFNLFCIDFISCCLQKDTKKRASYDDLCNHPFITGIEKDWKKLEVEPSRISKWKGKTEIMLSTNNLTRTIEKVEVKKFPPAKGISTKAQSIPAVVGTTEAYHKVNCKEEEKTAKVKDRIAHETYDYEKEKISKFFCYDVENSVPGREETVKRSGVAVDAGAKTNHGPSCILVLFT